MASQEAKVGYDEAGNYSTVGLKVRIRYFGGREYVGTITKEGRKNVDIVFRTRGGRVVTVKSVQVGAFGLAYYALDQVTRDLSAFASFQSLLDAQGGYRPTILPRSIGHRILAAHYDAAQAKRGDERRAYTGSTL
jgi:hypothetical protein